MALYEPQAADRTMARSSQSSPAPTAHLQVPQASPPGDPYLVRQAPSMTPVAMSQSAAKAVG